MKELTYVIKGDPRTKKNHQMIAGAGKRCPVCGKFEKQWIRQGHAHDEYVELALWQLRPKPSRPIDFSVNVRCLFYMKTKRTVDQGNLILTVDDLLVTAKILKDDDRKYVFAHDGSRVLDDPINPRTEIYITRVAPEQLSLF